MKLFKFLAPFLMAVSTAASNTVQLVTFDGQPSTTKKFEEVNDPVMGGKSTGTFSVKGGVGVFDGEVVDVPFLKAPGFIKAQSTITDYANIQSCKSITIKAKSSAKYDGFRLSFGTKRQSSCSFFSSGFKAHFDAPVSTDFQEVKLPLSNFSDCNSDSTGEPTKTCAQDKNVCPDKDTLSNMRTVSIWAEGAKGKVHLEIESIFGSDCAGLQDDTAPQATCTTYEKVVNGTCAEDCLPDMIGLCPVSLVVKAGGLTKGDCKSLGYTVPAAPISQKAGPCGTLHFKAFTKGPEFLASSTSKISLVSFDPSDKAYKKFDETNDPVMGGKSQGQFTVKDKILQWRGEVVNVPSLQAPGFIKINSEISHFDDINSCKAIEITARAAAKYDGYRFSFGTKRGFLCSFFSSGFKAKFEVNVSSDFQTITIPFEKFSDCNSDSTGEPSKLCADDSRVCPDKKTLSDLETVSLWAEGAAGKIELDVKDISATGCSSLGSVVDESSDLTLVTFDGKKGTSHKFVTLNDPVMGGQSSGTFNVANNIGVFSGDVKIVPKLKAPGFLEVWANDGHYTDVSSASEGALVLRVRSNTPNYEGFRVSFAAGALSPTFACAAGGSIIGSRGCFKANFKVPSGDNFVDVVVPFNTFSDKWSSATGEQTSTCKQESSVCPTEEKLKKIQAIGIWAEGKEGHVHLEIESISARSSSTSSRFVNAHVNRGTVPPKEFDTCKGQVQSNLRYNMSQFTTPAGIPVDINGTESLATAVCCDSRTKVFAEPRFLFQNPYVDLFQKLDASRVTTFYDSVCGLPLFKAPVGRTFSEFKADTTEHGWPSFREKEIISENVITDKNGFVYSKCGTHLGSYLPDGKNNSIPRWCLDLSCLSGSPVSSPKKFLRASKE